MQEVKKYESQRTANKSTYWVIFELTWRDYYRFFALRFGDAIFQESGITDRRVRALGFRGDGNTAFVVPCTRSPASPAAGRGL